MARVTQPELSGRIAQRSESRGRQYKVPLIATQIMVIGNRSGAALAAELTWPDDRLPSTSLAAGNSAGMLTRSVPALLLCFYLELCSPRRTIGIDTAPDNAQN
jgi:hypothetical protein